MTAKTDLLPLPEWMSHYTIPADDFAGVKVVMLADRMHDYARANVARATAALQAEVEALRAEVERLNRYYKNGIDCFANPCEKHSGERTPPFAEFFEKYGGQCLICVVDNNKALQAKNERLTEALKELITWIPSADTYRHLGFDPEAPMRVLGEARAALAQGQEEA